MFFKKHKIITSVVLIILLAGLGTYYYKSSNSKTVVTQPTTKVDRRDLVATVSATGTIQAVNTVDISSKITAQIKEVKVKENDKVTTGQILVVLEDTTLQAEVTQAREKLNNLSIKYQRTAKMNQIGGASKEEFDNAYMDYKIAQASYEGVMSKLNETVIAAPIDGTVIGKPLSAGELVAQGVNNPTVILTVADMSKMQINAKVDQTDIGKISAGQLVTFSVDAYPDQEFTGKVSNISRKPVTEQNVTYYQVTIDVDDTEKALNPGMTARVTMKISEKNAVLTIPLSALKTDKNGKYVVCDENGKTINVPVVTGITSDDRIEIVSGLTENDNVVIPQSKTKTSSQQNRPPMF